MLLALAAKGNISVQRFIAVGSLLSLAYCTLLHFLGYLLVCAVKGFFPMLVRLFSPTWACHPFYIRYCNLHSNFFSILKFIFLKYGEFIVSANFPYQVTHDYVHQHEIGQRTFESIGLIFVTDSIFV